MLQAGSRLGLNIRSFQTGDPVLIAPARIHRPSNCIRALINWTSEYQHYPAYIAEEFSAPKVFVLGPSMATLVETTINYFPETGGTTSYVTGSPEFFTRKFTPTKVQVQDIRGNEGDFNLDQQGFQLVQHRSEMRDFKDEERVKDLYFKETEKLIRDV
jgi:hypothetical protein